MSRGSLIAQDIRALALPKGRRVGQPGHQVALEYLRARMKAIGLRPFREDGFEVPFADPGHRGCREDIRFVNLVGVVPGTAAKLAGSDLPVVLLGAHYDSPIDAPCADDNAAAVAAVLAAAQDLVRTPLARDVIIALFDSEEPPYFQTEAMGSTRFYLDELAGRKLACAVILDLVGHDVVPREALGLTHSPLLDLLLPGLRDLLVVTGSESHPRLPAALQRACGATDGLNVYPTPTKTVGDMSDHHVFRMSGEPYLFLTCGRGRHYHTPQDDLDWVNLDKVGAVHGVLLELARALDEIGDPAAAGIGAGGRVDRSSDAGRREDTRELAST